MIKWDDCYPMTWNGHFETTVLLAVLKRGTLSLHNAGDVNWVAWKPFIAFLLCEKEGNRGYCGADTGSDFDLRCNCPACNGRGHASALLYGHFSCCSNWLAIKFLELLWNAQCWNLALLGRFYHCLWIVGPPSGTPFSVSLLHNSKYPCTYAFSHLYVFILAVVGLKTLIHSKYSWNILLMVL